MHFLFTPNGTIIILFCQGRVSLYHPIRELLTETCIMNTPIKNLFDHVPMWDGKFYKGSELRKKHIIFIFYLRMLKQSYSSPKSRTPAVIFLIMKQLYGLQTGLAKFHL